MHILVYTELYTLFADINFSGFNSTAGYQRNKTPLTSMIFWFADIWYMIFLDHTLIKFFQIIHDNGLVYEFSLISLISPPKAKWHVWYSTLN